MMGVTWPLHNNVTLGLDNLTHSEIKLLKWKYQVNTRKI